MEEIIFELETITPLFIASADQRNIENEGLRAPSLRGLLRWWFRALAGNYTGNDIVSLKRAEDEIFGSTTSKSKMSLITSGENEPIQITRECRSWNEATVWSNWVDYFFFSCLDKRKDRRKNRIKVNSKPFYPETSKFKIIMFGEESKLRIYLSSFWALVYLGGIGFRARRGGGCLKIRNVKGNTFGLNFICKDPDQLEQFLKNNIEITLKLLGELFGHKHTNLSSLPEYAVLNPSHSALFIRRINGKDWKSALDEIGRWYIGEKRGRKFTGGFRMRLADYGFSHEIKDANRNGNLKSDKERRPYLGLPVTYATYKATLKEEKFERRASQLIFGVYEINGNYIPRILIFRSMFLPDFRRNFVIDKKIKRNREEVRITLQAQLPSSEQLIRNCCHDLLKNHWQVVWGMIK